MRSIFEACEPRQDIIDGDLQADIFAARLRDVVENTGPDVYRDPSRFFDNTYPTHGFRTLVSEVLQRLVGDPTGTNAVIRLETAFGGGKTHNLIGLYHLARGNAPFAAASILPKGVPTPAPDQIRVAAIVGTDLDPQDGALRDGRRVKTLWGELALQLAGPAIWPRIESSEASGAAPGEAFLEELDDGRPTLVLLDELAQYVARASAVPTATGKSDMGEQTVAFLMSLMGYASSRQHFVVVLTLAETEDAFARYTLDMQHKLAEASSVSGRQERVLTPTAENEISAIVGHRLFRAINQEDAKAASAEYLTYYRRLVEQQAVLPVWAPDAEYGDELQADYPFHPSFLTTLNSKTATIPNFQKTRGALRLLGLVVRDLWSRQRQLADVHMIHAHHLNLGLPDIAADLTSRLQRPAFSSVIEADIKSPRAGTMAHAEALDRSSPDGRAFATRAATTIFLHSLTQATEAGVSPAELALAVLEPGDEPLQLDKSVERLVDTAWHLEWDSHDYRFKTEPSINKVISDEASRVPVTRAKIELEGRVKTAWKSSSFNVEAFPSEPSKVSNDPLKPQLVILHFDSVAVSATDTSPPDLVRQISKHAGGQEAFRDNRNAVVFLVADKEQVEPAVSAARTYLAIHDLSGSSERLKQFTTDQVARLKQRAGDEGLKLRLSIMRMYRHLYYAAADAPADRDRLAHLQMPPEDQGELDRDQTTVVLRVLRDAQKVLTGEDAPLAPLYVHSKAWDHGAVSLTTEDLAKAFGRKLDLKILMDPAKLRETIRLGITQGQWVYFDAATQKGYGPNSPPPVAQITSEAFLYDPAEAKRLMLQVVGEERSVPTERCPVCLQPIDQCTCGKALKPALQHAGTASQVFQWLADTCRDRQITRLRRVEMRVQGSDREGAEEMRALALAVPQFGKGRFFVKQELELRFDSEGQREELRIQGGLSWDRYKQIRGSLETAALQASEAHINTTLSAEFDDGLEVGSDARQFQAIRDALSALPLGTIELSAEELTASEA